MSCTVEKLIQGLNKYKQYGDLSTIPILLSTKQGQERKIEAIHLRYTNELPYLIISTEREEDDI